MTDVLPELARPADAARATDASYARESISRGSQSFAAASRLLPGGVREDVWRLYAWCRHADDVIDGQSLGFSARAVADPEARLAVLRHATDEALAGRPCEDVFAGFAEVAARHGISAQLAHDHIDGFAMDVAGQRYASLDDLLGYCYGVAGSVGVMMALVMGVAPDDADTLDRACDLGLAFQLTNISRDVVADARVGRVYLPGDWLAPEGIGATPAALAAPGSAEAVWRVACRLVDAAEPYYASARVGAARLPFRAAWAILTATSVYRAIGVRRRREGAAGLGTRVGTGRATKLAMIAASLASAVLPRPAAARGALWTRPTFTPNDAASRSSAG